MLWVRENNQRLNSFQTYSQIYSGKNVLLVKCPKEVVDPYFLSILLLENTSLKNEQRQIKTEVHFLQKTIRGHGVLLRPIKNLSPAKVFAFHLKTCYPEGNDYRCKSFVDLFRCGLQS